MPVDLSAWSAIAQWPVRRWVVAGLAAVSTVLVVGIPTVLVPTPVFGREVAVTGWAWPALVVTSLLAGLVAATYVRAFPLDPEAEVQDVRRAGLAGGFLTYLAVGCPVCNKIALLALGYTGALQWFAPVQPLLAVAGIGLLGYALHRRLQGEIACRVPAAR
jgi:hypothetical protein